MLAVLLGAGLALWSGWRCRTAPALPLLLAWGSGSALFFAGTGWTFASQAMGDHAAMAYAAALSFMIGHACGLLLLWLSPQRPVATALGLAMALGLPPFGAFPGLWLGLQAIQASLLLLPAMPAIPLVAGGLACLAGGLWAGQGALSWTSSAPAPRGGWARGPLMGLGILAGFLPWLWVLPAQVMAAWISDELPILLVALGMMLTAIIPGQGSVIPFGILAIAMAFSSVLLLVLRLTRQRR